MTNNYMELAVMDKTTFDAGVESWSKVAHISENQAVEFSQHALLHFHKSGDVHYMNKLYKSMPKSMRKAALMAWFKGHAPVVFDEKTKQFSKDRGEEALPTFPANVEGNEELIMKTNQLIQSAFNTHFYEYTREIAPDLPDAEVYLKASLKKILAKVDKIIEEKGALDPDTADQVHLLRNVARNIESLAA